MVLVLTVCRLPKRRFSNREASPKAAKIKRTKKIIVKTGSRRFGQAAGYVEVAAEMQLKCKKITEIFA